MRMTDDEFVRTRPAQVSIIDVAEIDHPADQPAYVGMRITTPSEMDPRTTVQYTFKLDPEQARQLSTDLHVSALHL